MSCRKAVLSLSSSWEGAESGGSPAEKQGERVDVKRKRCGRTKGRVKTDAFLSVFA